jgi:hypothetical protein
MGGVMAILKARVFAYALTLLAIGVGGASGQATLRDESSVGFSMTMVRQEAQNLDSALRQIPITPATNPVRVHLRVTSAGLRNWTVILEDLSGAAIETISPDEFVDGEYWTDEIVGGSCRLRVKGATQDTVIVVDGYAVAGQLAQPQGIFGGRDESLPITDGAVPAAAKKAAPAVARVQFMTDTGGADCTGFLLGATLLMTNYHCINTDARRASARVYFGVDSATAAGTQFKVTKIEASDRYLDYSLLRLATNASAFGRMYMGARPTKDMSLFLIQHPNGKIKKAAFPPHCSIGALRLPGVEQRSNDFGHTCDTLGGSSGSPIVDTSSGTVVGLHHWNLLEGVPGSLNQGVQMPLIVADLRARAALDQMLKPAVDEVTRVRPLGK